MAKKCLLIKPKMKGREREVERESGGVGRGVGWGI
jgi:hypothetical protein